MIKAVFFDMDGVLVDSEELSIEIGIRYFKERGYDARRENFLSHLGTGMSDFILRHILSEDADRFYRFVYSKELESHPIAMKGAREVLENMREMGLKIAICSSAQRWKVEANISSLGLSPSFFDLVIAEDMIRRNKSNPDIYLLAAAMLGVDISDAVVFEDSPGGVLSGINAGLRTVALCTTMERAEAESSGATRVIENIDELSGIKDVLALEDYLFSLRNKDILYGASYVKASGQSVRAEDIARCITAAMRAREGAYAPYSGYKVGAALISASSGKTSPGSFSKASRESNSRTKGTKVTSRCVKRCFNGGKPTRRKPPEGSSTASPD